MKILPDGNGVRRKCTPKRTLFKKREQYCAWRTKRKDGIMVEEMKVEKEYLMIKMPEEIDHHNSVEIGKRADRFILSEKIEHVVFDFEKTRFMDSSGIGILIGRYKRISCFGGKVFAVHADRQIKRLLLLSGLEKIVEIMD